MKHLLALLLLLRFFSAAAQFFDPRSQTIEEYMHSFVGKKFGQFKIKTSNSTTFSNADLSGKITLVNFWFESCHPCMAEMEGLNTLYDSLKGNTAFRLVSFTFEPLAMIQTVKNKFRVQYPVFHIEHDDCVRLNFNAGFPASFILDKNGVIIHAQSGGVVDEAFATKLIMILLYPKIVQALAQNGAGQ